jgi:hypothetical protein
MEPRAIIGNTPSECTLNQEGSLLSVAEIRTDGGTQNRATDSSVVRQYAALMADETVFPPLTVWFDGTYYWLTDGFHRLAAAAECGFKFVNAYIHTGSLEDAIWDSFCANSQHGLRRKRSDIVVLIDRALKHSKASSLSNVQIGKHLGIPEATVRRWRKRLSSSSDDDACRKVNRNGTSYTLHLKKVTPRHGRSPQQKSKEQLKRELLEMMQGGSFEVNQLLTVIDDWLFAGGTPNDCLRLLSALFASARMRTASK